MIIYMNVKIFVLIFFQCPSLVYYFYLFFSYNIYVSIICKEITQIGQHLFIKRHFKAFLKKYRSDGISQMDAKLACAFLRVK